MTDWQKIKTEFIVGATLNSLAGKYQISLETIKTRHRTDHWAQARKNYKQTVNEITTKKLAEEQAHKTLNAIEVIDTTIEDLLSELPKAIINSKEGLARAISELLKVRGTYTGETVQKKDVSHSIPVSGLIKGIIDEIQESKD